MGEVRGLMNVDLYHVAGASRGEYKNPTVLPYCYEGSQIGETEVKREPLL